MFTALLAGDDCSTLADVREALADAGCLDIETLVIRDARLRLEAAATRAKVVVVDLGGSDLPELHRLAHATELPLVVLCEERQLDEVLLAGATEGVVKPVRPRELAVRVAHALRVRDHALHEQRLSAMIQALRHEKQELERLACVDPLTGVANRRHALAMLEAEWRRSTREHLPLGLVMIDLDCYHAYNEQYGHQGGDLCLQRVTEAMVRCLRRPSDYLGRYGGEEFMVVLPNTDAVGAKIVAERLRAAVEALAIPHQASVCSRVVTITAGFASLKAANDLSEDRLIAVADGALLRAKSQGRNRIEGDAPLVRPIRMSAQRWQRFAPVFADPWFADRIPGFLAEAQASARNMAQALRSDALPPLDSLTSELRAAARALDLSTIDRMLAQVELAITDATAAPTARDIVEELLQYITHVQVIYRRPTEPHSPQLVAP